MAELPAVVADAADSDGEGSVYGDDADASGWYAAAAGAKADDEEEEEEEEEAAVDPEVEAAPEDGPADDPYMMAVDDPYAAASDPYATTDTTSAIVAADPDVDGAVADAVSPPAKIRRLDAPAQTPPPAKAPPPAIVASPFRPPPPLPAGGSPRPPPPQLPRGHVRPPPPQLPPARPAPSVGPPPAPPMPALPEDDSMVDSFVLEDELVDETGMLEEPVPEVDVEEEVPQDSPDDEMVDVPITWDESCIVVRQGQLYIELMHRSPPMQDIAFQAFADWLDAQLPLVVQNHRYLRRSGAYVDLSDNVVGPEGLDKLFRVLRDHKVPLVVLKAYRNKLDDSIVDTIIEYLYTQPESFPMHGIHISHNNITDKGALRLIKAAAQCGHYPRLTSRLPLWLRLECNDIKSPQKVITDCEAEGCKVHLMNNGMCERDKPQIGVHVQLPYFLNQHKTENFPSKHSGAKGKGKKSGKSQQSEEDKANDLLQIYRSEAPAQTDEEWRRDRKTDTVEAAMMMPAPKRQNFAIAPSTAASQPPQRPMPMQRVFRPTGPPPTAAEEPVVAGPSAENVYISFDSDLKVSSEGEAQASDFGGQKSSSWKGGGKKGWKGKGQNKGDDFSADISWKNSGGWKGKDGGGGNGWKDAGCKGSGGWNQDDGDFSKSGKGSKFGKDSKGGKGGKDSKGGKGKGGKGGKEKKGSWVGPTLTSKIKKDVTINDGDGQLGFQWQYMGGGVCPQVIGVVPGTKVAHVAEVGKSLLRMNGLDASMLTEKQVTDLLKTRPMALRFGDQ